MWNLTPNSWLKQRLEFLTDRNRLKNSVKVDEKILILLSCENCICNQISKIYLYVYKHGRCGMIVNETAIHQKQTKFKLVQVTLRPSTMDLGPSIKQAVKGPETYKM